MCDDYTSFLFLESLDEEHQERMLNRRRTRNSSNPFNLEDWEFVKRYRLTKDLVRNLCEELRPHMRSPSKSTDLTVETKVLIALSFFATGSYQRPTGNIGSHSVSQPTVSVVLKEVVELLNRPDIQAKYIKFPRTAPERRANILQFFNKFGMPGVLGCIDCTHVAIIRPTTHEERYYCRKQYHSLNVQLICNANQEIISVDASYGGATHDSFIWANHPVKLHMEELSTSDSVWLLGDSGYALRKYLMTPVTNAVAGSPEAHYTNMHVRTRCVIERTIGLLKARFRCLLVHRVLHYAPHVAAKIVNACVVLHNLCVQNNVETPELPEEELALEVSTQQQETHQSMETSNNRALSVGLATRSALIARLWSSRPVN